MSDDFETFHPSLEDFDGEIADAALEKLNEESQLKYVLAWFRYYFEDPANETPYESKEGGYQYVLGGPYDAREELSSQFDGIVSEALLERAAQDLDRFGHEWAPTSNHPDRSGEGDNDDVDSPAPDLDALIRDLESGTEPRFDERGSRLRTEVLQRLDAIEAVLLNLPHGGLGHNQPPEPLALAELPVVSEEQSEQIELNVEIIRVAMDTDAPDALSTVKAASRLRDIASWLGKKLDVAVDEAAKAVGKAAGLGLVGLGIAEVSSGHHLLVALMTAVHAIAVWAETVTSPF